MFNIEGKKSYKVNFVFGGVSQKGTAYTFITAESEIVGNSKYPDKIKINIWGSNLSSKLQKDDYIKIMGAKEVGITKTKAKEGDKWFENLTLVCNESDIVLGDKPAVKEEKQEMQQVEMTPIELDELPF